MGRHVKYCPSCKQPKTVIDFGKDRRCKQCCNEKSKLYRASYPARVAASNKRSRKKNPSSVNRSLRKARLTRFGLSEQMYSDMLQKQNYVCAVCKNTDKRALAVDHCHKSGVVRGLLCGACNKAEGLLRSNPEIMRALANYVELHNKGM